MKAPPFTLTNESVTIVWEGKTHSVKKGSPHFLALRKAVLDEKWDDVPNHLTVAKSLKEWAKGKVTLSGDTFSFDGEEIPNNINSRIIKMATGGEDPTPLFKFWERLKKNPSWRSVKQLWDFLSHQGIPLTKDGTFLAYKSVKADYKDVHSGQFDNKPGVVNEMPRNQISDDPNHACHEGFHVGALGYAKSFHSGGRIVVCEVDPENVVSVPYDSSSQKMRVCKYKVIGNHNGTLLPDTTFVDDRGSDEAEEAETDDSVFNAEDNYNPEKDFLATPCEECGKRIPDADPSEDNKFHDPSCSLYKEEKKKAQSVEKRVSKKGFAKLDNLDMLGLLKESIEDLRRYAGKGLQIVGASKIPGGKTALVAKILEVRR